jgi:predicted SprT family Zn-dependent metalloprotease
MNQENIKTKKIKVNTYSDVYESCSICGKNMYKTKDIYVDRGSDRYVCGHCKDKYEIEAIRCRDLD